MAPQQRHEVRRLQELVTALGTAAEGAAAFPAGDIFPRDEIQAGAFVAEHPAWDGRGIKVAIFDTGVDPGAGGLAVTSDGLPKIVDCVDATGSGDVDTSTVLEGSNAGGAAELRGLTGRTLLVPSAESCPAFTNPSGRWHVGMLSAFHLFPGGLVARLRSARQDAWDESQRQLEQRLEAEIAAAAASEETDSEALADLRLRLDEARALDTGADPGPIFDVLAWHDGDQWKAAVDTTEAGDLAECVPMSDFKVAQEWSTFGPSGDAPDSWLLNYNLNIWHEGNIVEVVTNAGAHGTHVAATTAGYFPDQPELNGIAPGAQLVSVKIGDSRLGSAETGTGMIRGLVHAIAAGVHVINMSFGEATSLPHTGRIGELLEEAIHRHKIIFVTSAGNSGPGLGTVGSPAAQAVGTISVGALISPAMMQVTYSMRHPSPKAEDDGRGMLTTWSSRGPTLDGDRGVDICAPGAAIASVPTDTLTSMMMMNGTSMASPNACGGVALLLSAALANNIEFTSESIKGVVLSSAADVAGQEAWAQGCGLLQVCDAWEALRQQSQRQGSEPLVWFEVNVGMGAKGIYLRELEETQQPLEASVAIRPRFRESPEGDDLDRAAKGDFHVRISLECDDDFVAVPEHMVLMSEPRMFSVLVDPCHPSLASGEVCYSEVRGRNSETGEVCFRVPVTIALPVTVQADTTAAFSALQFVPGTLHRRFVSVPAGGTQMAITVTAVSAPPQGSRTFMLHLSQRVLGRKHSDTDSVVSLAISSNSKIVHTCDCEPGYTMEICLAQMWNSLGDGTIIDVEVAFFGLETSAAPIEAGPGSGTVPRLSLTAMQPVTAVHVRASLRQTMLAPSASLTAVEHACSATSYSISALDSSRDMWPASNRLFKQLLLSYDLDVAVAGRTTIRVPLISDVIYESIYDSQLIQVFNSRQQYVGATDFHTSPIALAKGKHTVLVQVRHEDEAVLQGLVDMSPSLAVSRALARPVSVPIYSEFQGGGRAQKMLKLGDTDTVYVNAPALSESDRKALEIKPGDMLSGSVRLEMPGSTGRSPRAFPLQFLVPDAPAPAPKGNDLPHLLPTVAKPADGDAAEPAKEEDDELKELKEAMTKAEAVLKGAETAEDVAKASAGAIEAADALLERVDPASLHQDIAQHEYQGKMGDSTSAEWKAEEKKLSSGKAAMVSALSLKAHALMDKLSAAVGGSADVPLRLCVRPASWADDANEEEAAFVGCLRELSSWGDASCEAGALAVRWALWQDKLGLAAQLLRTAIGSSGVDDDNYVELQAALPALLAMLGEGWGHWDEKLAAKAALGNPSVLVPF